MEDKKQVNKDLPLDLAGLTIGGIAVLNKIQNGGRSTYYLYNCRCVCGKDIILSRYLLDKINKTARGCVHSYKREPIAAWNRTHNMRDSIEYKSWSMMKNRCSNPKSNRYKYYIEKGIKVCDRWIHSFENFYEDMGVRPSLAYSIDRIDNSKGYYPENCRWATTKQQSNNQSSNILITYNGETRTIAQWSDYTSIPYKTLHGRIRVHGWSVEKSLTTRVGADKRLLYESAGEFKTIKEWCAITGIAYGTVIARMSKRKWDYKKALFTPLNNSK